MTTKKHIELLENLPMKVRGQKSVKGVLSVARRRGVRREREEE